MVLIPTTAEVGADVIAAAPKLKLIVQPASGTDNICLDAAQARGIPVCTGAGKTVFLKEEEEEKVAVGVEVAVKVVVVVGSRRRRRC